MDGDDWEDIGRDYSTRPKGSIKAYGKTLEETIRPGQKGLLRPNS